MHLHSKERCLKEGLIVGFFLDGKMLSYLKLSILELFQKQVLKRKYFDHFRKLT